MSEAEKPAETEAAATKAEDQPPKKDAGTANANVQNSFSANSPYYSSYVENEMRSMNIMHDTLKDIAARTKTFGKCGALMSESTRRLALACRLRRPYTVENDQDKKEIERQHEMEVAERRRAVGDDMASLLSVMSEVSGRQGINLDCSSSHFLPLPNRCSTRLLKHRCKCASRLK